MIAEKTNPAADEGDNTPPAKNAYKKYALLLTPLVVLALLELGLSYLFSSDTSPTPPAPPPAATQPEYKTPKIKLTLFAKDLPNTTAIISRSGDSRLYVLDQDGLIRIVDANGDVDSTPFLDIRNRVRFSGEMGLLGMAFSPNYQTDDYFFINYVDNIQRTVVARYHALSADHADPASEQKV